MGIDAFQGEALAALDAAYDRACLVVEPELLDLVTARIAWLVADAPEPVPPTDQRAIDVVAVIDQMLLDVARVDDDVVRRAGRHFPDGGLADLVTASYVIEARTRLDIVSDRLLGPVS